MSNWHMFVRTAAMFTASVAGVFFVLDLTFRNAKSSSGTGRRRLTTIGPSRETHARNNKASRPHILSSSFSFTTAYLGNGCFWARQKEFVAVEQESSAFGHRSYAQITSLAGYAGSNNVGPRGLVCYHGGPRGTVTTMIETLSLSRLSLSLSLSLFLSLSLSLALALALFLSCSHDP